MLGEGSQLALAVTEETTSSTPVAKTAASTEKTTDSSEIISEEVSEASTVETTTSSSTEETTETTTEKKESKETKKEKADSDKIKPQAANDPVNIPDPTLYQVIRETLIYRHGQTIVNGTQITEAQMEMLTQVNRTSLSTAVDSSPIGNLEGIQYATNLESLVLDGKYVQDSFTGLPTGFSNLKKLKTLKFSVGSLNDLTELKDHPALTIFSATNNNLDSLNGLSGCTELENLTVNQNEKIENFKGLEQSTKLKEIHFTKADEQTGSTLATIDQPEASYLGYGLQSLEGLNCKNSLEILDLLGHPGLHTLTGLENYSKLRELSVIGASNYNGRDYYYKNPGGVDDIDFDPAVHTQTYHKRGLRGPNALVALSNCTSLEKVQLNKQAIDDISPLAGKSTIKELNLGVNLIETLEPLKTTNNLVRLYAQNNLLANLKGLETMNVLEYLDVSSQNAGATTMVRASYQQNIRYDLKGLLADITALNSTSLKELDISDNRLDDISSLKNASQLMILTASNNYFSDIKGDLAGCSSLSKVNFNNNQFVNFKDTGLEDAKDSLKELYMSGQGLLSNSAGNTTSSDALLKDLEGLKIFTIIEKIDMHSNQIKDSEMKHIPDSIIELVVDHNELQDKAFSTFKPTTHTRLNKISGGYNHISNITPLEAFSTLTSVYFPRQSITVPKHGGIFTKKTTPVGFEVDVLKSDQGTNFTFTPTSYWLGGVTPTLKQGGYIFDVDDPDYAMQGRNPSIDFNFGGSNTIGGLTYNGSINFSVDYGIGTTAGLKLVPTDINGNEITEITPGGLIYWRATVDSENANYLISPNFGNYLFGVHELVNSYTDVNDLQASEYVKGARVEINGVYVPTPEGIWSKPSALTNKINKNEVATITILTKVGDTIPAGTVVPLRFYFSGKNFPEVADRKEVVVKAAAPEELNLTAPKRFDFGKRNEANKKAQSYGLDTKAHSTDEQTNGFKIRVTDSMQSTNRVAWEVVGKLSDLSASNGDVLKNASTAPKLSLKDISLAKITDPGGTETSTPITPGATNVPTWQTSIDLIAGGSSVTLSEAAKADGEGVWDYQIPFDKVKLEVPSNVNNQAGRTFNGKITWTLDDTL